MAFTFRELRRATLRIEVDFTPASLNEWGALGGVIGRLAGNYWAVPAIEGIDGAPKSDQLKHFGAAMASFGSIALFHLLGLTPEAAGSADVAAGDCRACASPEPMSMSCRNPITPTIGSMSWCSRRRS